MAQQVLKVLPGQTELQALTVVLVLPAQLVLPALLVLEVIKVFKALQALQVQTEAVAVAAASRVHL
jgi:hypothetical protein